MKTTDKRVERSLSIRDMSKGDYFIVTSNCHDENVYLHVASDQNINLSEPDCFWEDCEFSDDDLRKVDILEIIFE
jgi:hypothetical protein